MITRSLVLRSLFFVLGSSFLVLDWKIGLRTALTVMDGEEDGAAPSLTFWSRLKPIPSEAGSDPSSWLSGLKHLRLLKGV
jgi:hypothetical protein